MESRELPRDQNRKSLLVVVDPPSPGSKLIFFRKVDYFFNFAAVIFLFANAARKNRRTHSSSFENDPALESEYKN